MTCTVKTEQCERCAHNDHVLTQILIIPTPYDAITILHQLFVHRLSDLLAHKMCKPQQVSNIFNMAHSDSCAVNADGSLKDAKDIVFYHDLDDSVPLDTTPSAPQPSSSTNPPQDAFSMLLNTGHKPTPVTAGARQSICTSKPSACLQDAENIYSTSTSTSSTNRKRALSSAPELQLQPAHKRFSHVYYQMRIALMTMTLVMTLILWRTSPKLNLKPKPKPKPNLRTPSKPLCQRLNVPLTFALSSLTMKHTGYATLASM
jgi:hypothetical protein